MEQRVRSLIPSDPLDDRNASRRDRRTLNLAAYESERDREYASYLEERARYYAAEERWASTPFWRRRASGCAPGNIPVAARDRLARHGD